MKTGVCAAVFWVSSMEIQRRYLLERLQAAADKDHRVQDIQVQEHLGSDGFWAGQVFADADPASSDRLWHFLQQLPSTRFVQPSGSDTVSVVMAGLVPMRVAFLTKDEQPLQLLPGCHRSPNQFAKEQGIVDDLLLRCVQRAASYRAGCRPTPDLDVLQSEIQAAGQTLAVEPVPQHSRSRRRSADAPRLRQAPNSALVQFARLVDEAYALCQAADARVDRREALWRELRWFGAGGTVPPLVTKRLLLRELAWHDFEAMHRWSVDPEVVKYMDWGPNTRTESKAHLQQAISEQRTAAPKLYEFAICRTDNPSCCLGTAALTLTNRLHGEASLGYTLARPFWRQGVMTEAVQALLHWGWHTLDLHRVWATCSVENRASHLVLERAGLLREGRLRDHRFLDGRWHDSFLYGITSPLDA